MSIILITFYFDGVIAHLIFISNLQYRPFERAFKQYDFISVKYLRFQWLATGKMKK